MSTRLRQPAEGPARMLHFLTRPWKLNSLCHDLTHPQQMLHPTCSFAERHRHEIAENSLLMCYPLPSVSAIKAMADSPTMDWSCLCKCPICSIRAEIKSCLAEPQAKPLIPRLADSYSALICASNRATSLPYSLMCCMLALLCMSFIMSRLRRCRLLMCTQMTGILNMYNVVDMFKQRIKRYS